MILKIKWSDCVTLPHNHDKALAVHPHQQAPVHVKSYCAIALE